MGHFRNTEGILKYAESCDHVALTDLISQCDPEILADDIIHIIQAHRRGVSEPELRRIDASIMGEATAVEFSQLDLEDEDE